MQFITSLSYWRLSENFFQRYDHEIRFFPLAGSNLIYWFAHQIHQQFHSHGFTTGCFCEVGDTCQVSNVTASNCDNGYVIPTHNAPICVKFGSGLQLTAESDDKPSNNLFFLSGEYLNVTINDGPLIAYQRSGVSTLNNGTILRGLVLFDNTTNNEHGVFFSECGPFIVQDGRVQRKRTFVLQENSRASASFQPAAAPTPAPTPPVAASGDPHLSGAHGIKFDVFGAPGANYSLLVAPAFEVNMQLAHRGPELRFMTAMAVLHRGKSFIITPNTAKAKSAELIAHFGSLGSKVSIEDDRVITIELCAAHTISFEAQHDKTMSYLNFEMHVPGCHDSYGGLLGQTYQCKYAKEPFKWSREHEKVFRVATLKTPSGSYSPIAECAHEDDYRGKPMSADSFSKKTDMSIK
jgi:hypothetical protein